MKQLAQTTQTTKATPQAIFDLWADVDNWAAYDHGIEWAKLDGDFKVGGTYKLKPKGGPKVSATIKVIEQNKHFVDVSHLPGAQLQFDHQINQSGNTTSLTLTMTISGPLSWLWARILGKNQQSDLESSTANLIAHAEGRS